MTHPGPSVGVSLVALRCSFVSLKMFPPKRAAVVAAGAVRMQVARWEQSWSPAVTEWLLAGPVDVPSNHGPYVQISRNSCRCLKNEA